MCLEHGTFLKMGQGCLLKWEEDYVLRWKLPEEKTELSHSEVVENCPRPCAAGETTSAYLSNLFKGFDHPRRSL